VLRRFACVALALCLAACGRFGCSPFDSETGKELSKLDHHRKVSPVIDAPAKPWKRAWLEVALASETDASRGGIEVNWDVRTSLVLEPITGNREGLELERLGGAASKAHVDAARAKWELRFSPDGTRLALSRDNGPWRPVGVDGTGLLPCAHLDLGSPPADPFARMPSLREVALAILTHPKDHRATDVLPETSWAAEWIAARPDDVEGNLVAARTNLAEDVPPEGAKQVAPRVPAVRKVYLEALAGTGEPAGRAARLLELVDDPAIQRALGTRAQELVLDGAPGRRDAVIAFSRNVEIRKAVEPEVEKALFDGPGDSFTGCYLIWALRALGTPRSRAALEEWAKGCPNGKVPSWPATIDEISCGVASCWAKSALASAGGKH
jgi:hypothetical protein